MTFERALCSHNVDYNSSRIKKGLRPITFRLLGVQRVENQALEERFQAVVQTDSAPALYFYFRSGQANERRRAGRKINKDTSGFPCTRVAPRVDLTKRRRARDKATFLASVAQYDK